MFEQYIDDLNFILLTLVINNCWPAYLKFIDGISNNLIGYDATKSQKSPLLIAHPAAVQTIHRSRLSTIPNICRKYDIVRQPGRFDHKAGRSWV